MSFDSSSWLSSFRGVDFDGVWPSIAQCFLMNSKRFPDKKCFEIFYPEYQCYTYKEVACIVERIAIKLRNLGLGKNERVAVCGKNSPHWAIAYLSILFAGCVVVPLDYYLNADEVKNLIEFAQVRFVFSDLDRIKNFENLSLLGKSSLDKIKDANEAGCPYILDLQEGIDETHFNFMQITAEDTIAILFTSGTTGTPKGVMLTSENFLTDVFNSINVLHLTSDDTFYCILPMHHAYSMLASFLGPLVLGSSIVFGQKMVAAQIFSDLRKGDVKVFVAVPLLYNKVLDGIMSKVRKKTKSASIAFSFMLSFFGFLKKYLNINLSKIVFHPILKQLSMDNLKVCICGGGYLHPLTCKRFNQLGFNFVQGYGMTETSPIITLSPIHGYRDASVGAFLKCVEAKIVDPDIYGNGVLYVKGPIVMKGYYNNEAMTKEVFDSDGFLNTGDIGYLDKNNFFYITGRKKNIIVTSGGKNVYPEEIEELFANNKKISQIVIASYKTQDGAEGIKAIVYPNEELLENKDISIEKIQDIVKNEITSINKKLASYKKISKIQLSTQPFELTSSRKIKRSAVVKLFDNDDFIS